MYVMIYNKNNISYRLLIKYLNIYSEDIMYWTIKHINNSNIGMEWFFLRIGYYKFVSPSNVRSVYTSNI